jgi:hypothetical protein
LDASGDSDAPNTVSLVASAARSSLPSRGSQNWISPKRAGVPPPAIIRLPSAENAIDRMRSALPGSRFRSPLPSARCSSTSRLPLTASICPSGEKRSAVMTGG